MYEKNGCLKASLREISTLVRNCVWWSYFFFFSKIPDRRVRSGVVLPRPIGTVPHLQVLLTWTRLPRIVSPWTGLPRWSQKVVAVQKFSGLRPRWRRKSLLMCPWFRQSFSWGCLGRLKERREHVSTVLDAITWLALWSRHLEVGAPYKWSIVATSVFERCFLEAFCGLTLVARSGDWVIARSGFASWLLMVDPLQGNLRQFILSPIRVRFFFCQVQRCRVVV